MYHAAAVRQSRDQNPPANGVPLWTETACRFPPKPPAGLNRNRLSETPKFALSSEIGTRHRPPQVSSIAFPAPLPDLQPWSLMDVDFAISRPLVRPGMPHIRFLFVRAR